MLTRLRGRFVAAIAGIAFAVILCLVQLGFQSALYTSITRLYASMEADLFLISPEYQSIVARETIPDRRLYQALALPEVQSVAPIYMEQMEWINPVNQYERFLLLLGFQPQAGIFKLPGVSEHLQQIKQPDQILFDEDSRAEFGPIAAMFRKQGTVVATLADRQVAVAGLFRLGASFANSGHIITSDANFLRLDPARRPGDIDIGLIRLRSGSNADAVRSALAALLPGDVTVLTKQGFLDREMNYWSHNLPIGFLFRASLVMSLIVGAVVVYQILYSGISDNLPEFATLKAVGYSDRRLFRVVLQEALILSVLGFIPGVLLAWGVYGIVQTVTFLPVSMSFEHVAGTYLLALVMCIGAGALAMRRLYAADPAEVF